MLLRGSSDALLVLHVGTEEPEEDEEKKKGYLALLTLAKKVLETCIDLLGFTAPERM